MKYIYKVLYIKCQRRLFLSTSILIVQCAVYLWLGKQMVWHAAHLIVYRIVPFCMMRNSLLGVVMLCEIERLPFLKNVSGVQILLTIRLLRRKISIGPSNFSLSSIHVCRKNTSIVYSWQFLKHNNMRNTQ